MSDAIKFKDMPYERPDRQQTLDTLRALTARLEAATSYEEAHEVFLASERLARTLDTLENLAHIRHSIDTRDSFYEQEADFWNEFGPELAEPQQAWTVAMLESPFRADFEAQYGTLMFQNAEIEARSFAPSIMG